MDVKLFTVAMNSKKKKKIDVDVTVKPAAFIRYSRDRRAYRLYDLKERRIHESRDVIFIKEKVAYENIVNKEKVTDKFEYIDITSKKNGIDKRA